MTSLYLNSTLRGIEAAAADQPLMRRAGEAAALWAEELMSDRSLPVLVLAGPGNNGGDAFEAARQLREQFFDVVLVHRSDSAPLPPDAAAARGRFMAAGGHCATDIPEVANWGLIIDGLFGIGLTRAPADQYAAWIERANQLAVRDACPLLALDCPSGLDADRGAVFRPAIVASHTITFIAAKPGLYTADGPDHSGEIRIATLDLDAVALAPADGETVAPDQFAHWLRPRRRNTHKGSYGSAGVVGGAHSMLGAVFLAGRAALRSGAGRVYVGLLDPGAPSIDPIQPELMLRKPEGVLDAGLNALACGPGLGNSLHAIELLERALTMEIPVVLDADALNLVAFEGNLQVALASRIAPTLLTPHPAEAARLLDRELADVQADRIGAAREIALHYRCHVALKGCGTVVVTPEGRWRINTTGNPGMAAAGMGDVLTGIAVALLAQRWSAEAALAAAVYMHGAAGDALAAAGSGPVGLTAGELVDNTRAVLNRLIHGA